ncbi:hypothetical protein H4R23_001906 [Coemansia sp. Cherry 401B]|nr:hypothetical protein H4R23_001906 [Coemansia sp. Cherry 401B]
MVSYTDLSPLKQPDAPVVVHLNDPVQAPARKPEKVPRRDTRQPAAEHQSPEEWLRSWDQLHTKVLYFKGVTEDALPELQQLFKSCRGTRLNVDPHDSLDIAGNVQFRNVFDTEKAMALLNNRKLKENNGTLVMSPLPKAEIGPPPNGGYVHIKHIPEDASAAALYDFLRPSGTLYSCSILTHPDGRQKDSAHACFVDAVYAHAAIEQLNFAQFQGNNISIKLSRPPRQSLAKTATSSTSAGLDLPETSAPAAAQQPSQPPQPSQSSPQPSQSPPPPQMQMQMQPRRRAASPNGLSDGPGTGLGGVIVPGKLFVTNLHPTVSHKELFALFKKYGYIQSARVSIDAATQKSRGHGIVQFSDPTAALEALRECQGADIKGRKITMYQYEHVNKQGAGSASSSASPRAVGSQQDREALQPNYQTPQADQLQQNNQPGTVPFPRSSSVASSYASDSLLDPAMLRSLSEGSRNEVLTQKLVAEIASNPAIDTGETARIVDSFIVRPLEDILALLSDPGLLASEWDLEQKAALHLQYQQTSLRSPVSQNSSPGIHAVDDGVRSRGDTIDSVTAHMQSALISDAYSDTSDASPRRREGTTGIRTRDYDTEIEEFIEMLISKPENERKKKLGSKLFPLIKSMGYKESTKLTVWILDHMSQDVRSLAYTMNDSARLHEIVAEAQTSINTSR